MYLNSVTASDSNSMDTHQSDSQSGILLEDGTPLENYASNSNDIDDATERSHSNNSVTLTNSDVEGTHENAIGIEAKKVRKRGSKKKKKPDELLQCTICGRHGLTSEFCASGRFCSQRCVGAHASKCRADTLAAAAAAGETIEPRKRKRQKKDGGKKSGKKRSISLDKVRIWRLSIALYSENEAKFWFLSRRFVLFSRI